MMVGAKGEIWKFYVEYLKCKCCTGDIWFNINMSNNVWKVWNVRQQVWKFEMWDKMFESLKCETKSEPEAKLGQLCSKLHQHHISAPAPAKPIFLHPHPILRGLSLWFFFSVVGWSNLSMTMSKIYEKIFNYLDSIFHHPGQWPCDNDFYFYLPFPSPGPLARVMEDTIKVIKYFFSHNFYVSICVISL